MVSCFWEATWTCQLAFWWAASGQWCKFCLEQASKLPPSSSWKSATSPFGSLWPRSCRTTQSKQHTCLGKAVEGVSAEATATHSVLHPAQMGSKAQIGYMPCTCGLCSVEDLFVHLNQACPQRFRPVCFWCSTRCVLDWLFSSCGVPRSTLVWTRPCMLALSYLQCFQSRKQLFLSCNEVSSQVQDHTTFTCDFQQAFVSFKLFSRLQFIQMFLFFSPLCSFVWIWRLVSKQIWRAVPFPHFRLGYRRLAAFRDLLVLLIDVACYSSQACTCWNDYRIAAPGLHLFRLDQSWPMLLLGLLAWSLWKALYKCLWIHLGAPVRNISF